MKKTALGVIAMAIAVIAGFALLRPSQPLSSSAEDVAVANAGSAKTESGSAPDQSAARTLRTAFASADGGSPEAPAARVSAIAEGPISIGPLDSPDSSKGYIQGRLQTFLKKADLTPAQHQQFLRTLYDVKLNWQSAYQDFSNAVLDGEESAAPDGTGLIVQAGRDLVKETDAKVATFLTPEQLEIYRDEIAGFIWSVAINTTFISEAGKPLPTPMK